MICLQKPRPADYSVGLFHVANLQFCPMASFSNSLTAWQDTIAAIATAQGVGALGILRMSGARAIDIADKLMPARRIAEQASHTLQVGWLEHEGKKIDEVVIGLFRAPRSFTGEDVVEFTCHGSPYVIQQILDAVTKMGARVAKPGEFTQRAFLHGKMDLTQAEAVADVIASQSAAAHQTALHQMRGGFSHALSALREQLIGFSALIELELDFATEDVEFADRCALQSMIANAKQDVAQLVDSFKLGNAIKQGVQVAIIGKPNAGKSTLLNALLQDSRAIVSDIPGTTRDTIEEVLNIDGILFRLIDTAGIRNSTDEIEALGIARSLDKMRQADIVIYLFDLQTESDDDILAAFSLLQKESRQFIMAGNKADCHPSRAADLPTDIPVVHISAKNETGLKSLKKQLVDTVLDGKSIAEQTVVTNSRHFVVLQQLLKGLNDVADGIQSGLTGDLLAIDIRQCLQYLGEITGTITHEDQLDFIFSKFCIGK